MSLSYTALSVGVGEDLLPLSVLLHKRGVAHRIFEEGGRQVLKVSGEAQAGEVSELYRAWRAGEVSIELTRSQNTSQPGVATRAWHRAPVVLVLVILSICGFLLVYLPMLSRWVPYLTFTPFQVAGEQLVLQGMGVEYWRLLTPVFLHFSWLHIVFNCLWLWELGSRIEQVMGHFNTLMLFIVVALVSNTSQYLFGGSVLFGGMSGVVYGLLGFAWIAPMLQPQWAIRPSGGIMAFMVGWLVLCLVGFVEVLGFGAVANAAHIGGLVCGGLLGAAFGFLSGLGSDNN